MTGRSKEEIAVEMSRHYQALGALWNEFSRTDEVRKPKRARTRETANELRKSVERKLRSASGS